MRPFLVTGSALAVLAVACSGTTDAPRGEGADAGSTQVPAPATSGSGTPSKPGPAPSADGGKTPGPDAAGVPDAGAMSTVRVHYPVAAGSTLSLRGSAGPLSWTKGIALTKGAADTWTYVFGPLAAPVDLKPVLDDTTWSRGPNYTLATGQTLDVYPHFTIAKGTVTKQWPAFTSTVLPSTRGVWVYLPPTYLENARVRMPVVYMHDAQNLFDPALAFGGNEWKVDETFDAASEDGTIREAIVIGVENTADRMAELTPGKGDQYLQMIAAEIKPMVDAALRTLPARATTAMAGSSLGGLITAYAGVHQADTFGLAASLSPSTWWNNRVILEEVATIPSHPARPDRVYVDSGDSGDSNDDVANTADLAAKYKDVGYVEGTTLHYVVQPGAIHNEVYWAQRFPGAMRFLLGAGR